MAENTKTEQEKTIQYAGDGLLADEEVVNTAVQQDVEAPENASTYKENKVNFMDFFAQIEEYLENDGKERVAEKTEEIGGEGQQGTRYRLTDDLHFVAGKNAEGKKYYQFDSYLNHSTMDISDDGVKTTYSDHKDAELPLDLDVEGWDLSSLDELIEYYDYKRYISPDIVSSLRGLKHEMDLAQEKTEKMEENQKNFRNYFNEIRDVRNYIAGREDVEINRDPTRDDRRSYILENGLEIVAIDHIGHDSFDIKEGGKELQLSWEQGEFRIACGNGDKSYSTSVKYDENLELPDSLETFIEQMEEQGYLSKGLVEKVKDLIEQTHEHQNAQQQKEEEEKAKRVDRNFKIFDQYMEDFSNVDKYLAEGKDANFTPYPVDDGRVEYGGLNNEHFCFQEGENNEKRVEIGEYLGNVVVFSVENGERKIEYWDDKVRGYEPLDLSNIELPDMISDLWVLGRDTGYMIQSLMDKVTRSKEAEMTQEQPGAPEQEPEKEEPNVLPSAVKATEETRFGKIAEMAKNLYEKVKGFFKGKEGPAKEEQDHGDR